jgi:hypothetical protein
MYIYLSPLLFVTEYFLLVHFPKSDTHQLSTVNVNECGSSIVDRCVVARMCVVVNEHRRSTTNILYAIPVLIPVCRMSVCPYRTTYDRYSQYFRFIDRRRFSKRQRIFFSVDTARRREKRIVFLVCCCCCCCCCCCYCEGIHVYVHVVPKSIIFNKRETASQALTKTSAQLQLYRESEW